MNKTIRSICLKPEETFEFGKKLGKQLKPGDLVLLEGELGAGKTYLTRGIVEGLVPEKGVFVSSPTYVIMHRYPVKNNIVQHMDLYRLESYEELEDLCFEECLATGGISIIEWADKFKLREKFKDAIQVSLTHKGENSREIILSGAENRTFIF
jgi:tRNA threonylcarbamoyladenosine biosynthesis protein TsaE